MTRTLEALEKKSPFQNKRYAQEAPDHKFISEHIPDADYKDWQLADGGGIWYQPKFGERVGSLSVQGAQRSEALQRPLIFQSTKFGSCFTTILQ